MSVINIKDFEITKGNKITKKSPIVLEALRRLRKERKFTEENFEEVIDPFEFFLMCYEVSEEKNKKKNNTNACKKDK